MISPGADSNHHLCRTDMRFCGRRSAFWAACIWAARGSAMKGHNAARLQRLM
jgi:hypothetical protein